MGGGYSSTYKQADSSVFSWCLLHYYVVCIYYLLKGLLVHDTQCSACAYGTPWNVVIQRFHDRCHTYRCCRVLTFWLLIVMYKSTSSLCLQCMIPWKEFRCLVLEESCDRVGKRVWKSKTRTIAFCESSTIKLLSFNETYRVERRIWHLAACRLVRLNILKNPACAGPVWKGYGTVWPGAWCVVWP